MRTHKRWVTIGLVLAMLLAFVPGASAAPMRQINLVACQAVALTAGNYILANDVVQAAALPCFIFGDDDISFDGGGHTITLLTGASAFSVGFMLQEQKSPSITNVNVTTPGNLGAAVGDFIDVEWAHQFSLTNSNLSCNPVDFGGGFCTGDFVDLNRVRDATIDGCTFTRAGDDAIDVGFDIATGTFRSNEVTISNNTIALVNDNGIQSMGTTTLTISGNDISLCGQVGPLGSGVAVGLGPAGELWQLTTIGNNDIHANTRDGISVWGDNNNLTVETLTIQDNHIYENSVHGMRINRTRGVVISGNKVERNGVDGLLLGANGNRDVTVGPDNEFTGNSTNGIELWPGNVAVTVNDNTLNNNAFIGLLTESDVAVTRNWIEMNGWPGVVVWGPTITPGGVVAHANVIYDNCRDFACHAVTWLTKVQVATITNWPPPPLAFGPAVNFEYNFWGMSPPPANQTYGPVDYDPWLDIGLSASSKVIANGRASALVTASIMGGPNDMYKVPDGLKVDMYTDLGFWGDMADKAATITGLETADGMATAKVKSDRAGWANLTGTAYEATKTEDRLVAFVPRKAPVSYPPTRSVVRTDTPVLKWAKVDSAQALVYKVKLIRLRPKPKKVVLKIKTDANSYQTPSLANGRYKLIVKACLSNRGPCGQGTRSVFRVRVR